MNKRVKDKFLENNLSGRVICEVTVPEEDLKSTESFPTAPNSNAALIERHRVDLTVTTTN